MKLPKQMLNSLGNEFTDLEQFVYKKLLDCGVRDFFVDRKTKQVYVLDDKGNCLDIYKDLVIFAKLTGFGA